MPPRNTSTPMTLVLSAVQADVKLVKVTTDRAMGVVFERIVSEESPLVGAPGDIGGALISGRSGDSSSKVVFDEYDETGITGTAVAPAPKRYGVTTDSGVVDVTEILERIDESVKLEGMRVEAFIDRRRVPHERIVGSYWVAPNGQGSGKVLALVRAAMADTSRVALVRWSKRTNQAVGVVVPHRTGGLVLHEFAFAAATREPPALPVVEVHAAEVEAAINLVQAMSDVPVVVEEMEDERMVLRKMVMDHALAGTLDDLVLPGEIQPVDMGLVEAFRAAAGDA